MNMTFEISSNGVYSLAHTPCYKHHNPPPTPPLTQLPHTTTGGTPAPQVLTGPSMALQCPPRNCVPWEVYMNREKMESWKGPTVPKEGMQALGGAAGLKDDLRPRMTEDKRMTEGKRMTEDKRMT